HDGFRFGPNFAWHIFLPFQSPQNDFFSYPIHSASATNACESQSSREIAIGAQTDLPLRPSAIIEGLHSGSSSLNLAACQTIVLTENLSVNTEAAVCRMPA